MRITHRYVETPQLIDVDCEYCGQPFKRVYWSDRQRCYPCISKAPYRLQEDEAAGRPQEER